MYGDSCDICGIDAEVYPGMPFEQLVGRTILGVDADECGIELLLDNGDIWTLDHSQDCCENVLITDIAGDWEDIIGSPLLLAEEATGDNVEGDDCDYESVTWTFYKLSTIVGHMTITWRGTSNGYYSEAVYVSKHVLDRASLAKNIWNLKKFFNSTEDLAMFMLQAV
jgi:hypothetical protein